MQELNKCPRCGQVLVAHEEIISVHGKLYCSYNCAIHALVDELRPQHPLSTYNELVTMAKALYYDDHEVVQSADVLGEDLQEVQIAVTYYKTIKLPKCMSEVKAKEVAEKLWNDSLVLVEPDDCDDVRFECELVKRHNSFHEVNENV